jgi:hypothetical protein
MGVEEAAAGVRTTLALAIAAPDGSTTCPRKMPEVVGTICPAAVWDTASVADKCNERKMSMKQKYFRTVIQYSIL